MKKGDSFRHLFQVTEEIHQNFIELFKDRNPLHTDRKFAVRYGFDQEVMHGNILNGFLSYWVGECLPIRNVAIHDQSIQYIHPVYRNDQLTLGVVVDDIFESVGSIELSFQFSNQKNTVVAKGKLQLAVLT